MALVVFVVATVAALAPHARPYENLFSRIDPLVGLAAVLASREWVAFWALALVTVLLTLVLGRVWCGWLCPVGTVLDVAPARCQSLLVARRWRLGKYVLLAVVLGAAALGSLGPMLLDPVAILSRPLQELVRPYFGSDAVGVNAGLDTARRSLQAVAFLSLAPLLAVMALNALGRRGWCRLLCPLGALLGLVSKLPGIRRVIDSEACTGCGLCARSCPTLAIERAEGFASAAEECIVCLECSDVCRDGASRFAATTEPLGIGFRQDKRDAVLGVGAAAAGFAVALLPLAGLSPEILRPPSTTDRRLAEFCVRCGACYSACPSGSLRPSLSLTSKAGPWTPMLDVRPAHCTLNCNRCARVCPTDALHTPTAPERISLGLGGVAHVDKSRCRVWAHGKSCMNCHGACPINGALNAVNDPEGWQPLLSFPEVDPALCVGCDECSQSCAVYPPAIGMHVVEGVRPTRDEQKLPDWARKMQQRKPRG